jgi:chemotaxis protein MotB
MRRRQRLMAEDENLQHIWPSFADVTSTFALLLFVLVLMAYVRNLMSSKQLAVYQEQIAGAEKRLSVLALDLEKTQREIATGRTLLSASERKLAAQQGIILASQQELEGLRARLSSIALLRVEVLEKVKRSIEAVLAANPTPATPPGGAQPGAPQPSVVGNGELVRIGDNGNIIINEGLVFEFNSFALKPSSTPLLDTLSRALEGVLDDPEVREYVDAIVVQGHTDDRGSGSFNRELSAKRANAVLDYVFSANPNLEKKYASYFAASAFSEFRPLDPNENEVAYERNRRIEISVALKDANVRKLIEQFMQSVPPQGGSPAGQGGAGAASPDGSQGSGAAAAPAGAGGTGAGTAPGAAPP